MGSPQARASNKVGWVKKPFPSFKRQYLENGGDTAKVAINR